MPRIPIEAKMICPHCRVAFISEWDLIELRGDLDGAWQLRATNCASCGRLILVLRQSTRVDDRTSLLPPKLKAEWPVWPRTVTRTPIPEEVSEDIAKDYWAACRVLPESSEASAALSRRCLQNLLIEKTGVKKRDLDAQIQEVIDAAILPRQLAEDLDVVRVTGNFGAHPIKSQSTGQIVPVEPGEAEWNLDVLEALFDFFFLQAERRHQRRETLNEKLRDAGKKPLR